MIKAFLSIVSATRPSSVFYFILTLRREQFNNLEHCNITVLVI